MLMPLSPFKAVAAHEVRILLGQVAKTGQIEASGTSIIERMRFPDLIFDQAGDSGPITCSQKLCPTCVLELPMPFG